MCRLGISQLSLDLSATSHRRNGSVGRRELIMPPLHNVSDATGLYEEALSNTELEYSPLDQSLR